MASKDYSPEAMDTLKDISQTQSQLLAAVESLSDRLNAALPGSSHVTGPAEGLPVSEQSGQGELPESDAPIVQPGSDGTLQAPAPATSPQRTSLTSRIVLTYVSRLYHLASGSYV